MNSINKKYNLSFILLTIALFFIVPNLVEAATLKDICSYKQYYSNTDDLLLAAKEMFKDYKDNYNGDTSNCSDLVNKFCDGANNTCIISCTNQAGSNLFIKDDTVRSALTSFCQSNGDYGDSTEEEYFDSLKSKFLEFKKTYEVMYCTNVTNDFCGTDDVNCIYSKTKRNYHQYLFNYCFDQMTIEEWTLQGLDTSGEADCSKKVSDYCMLGTDANPTIKSQCDDRDNLKSKCETAKNNYCASHSCTGSATGTYISVNKSGTISCDQITSITNFFNDIYSVLEIIAVVALVVLTMLDFAKAVMSDSEKTDEDMKKAKKHFVTRIAIVTVLVLLPILVKIIINAIGGSTCYLS